MANPRPAVFDDPNDPGNGENYRAGKPSVEPGCDQHLRNLRGGVPMTDPRLAAMIAVVRHELAHARVRVPSATKYLDDLRATLALLEALADGPTPQMLSAIHDVLTADHGTYDQLWNAMLAALLARAGGGG